MKRATMIVLVVLLPVQGALAMTLTVRNNADTGPESLRWAIERANSSPGPDIITFAEGYTIRPQTPLPALTESQTTINGEINGDGRPDVTLDGRDLAAGDGLRIAAGSGSLTGKIGPGRLPGGLGRIGSSNPKIGCTVRGLIIIGFPGAGLAIDGRSANSVFGCYFGVMAGLERVVPNAGGGITILNSSYNTIGGAGRKDGNFFSCASTEGLSPGIEITDSMANRIFGNQFGIGIPHAERVPVGSMGVRLVNSNGNQIGSADGQGNWFAGLTRGIEITASNKNDVKDNFFGLRQDGARGAIVEAAVSLQSATGNSIGGKEAGSRNTFVGAMKIAVRITEPGAVDNEVLGNYFGLMPDGVATDPVVVGINVLRGAGRQQIGSALEYGQNYFFCSERDIVLSGAGDGTVIESNMFRRRPDGQLDFAAHGGTAIAVQGVGARIIGNIIALADKGVWTYGDGAHADIWANRFARCASAVHINPGTSVHLGDLGNAETIDDGANIFWLNSEIFIHNQATEDIRAEGNNFNTRVAAEIDARILDGRDNPGVGIVDYDPLINGAHPR